MSTPLADYGAAVSRAREHSGLSVAALAARCHVDRTLISHVQAGNRRPHSAIAQRLDEVLAAGGELYELWQTTTSSGSASGAGRTRLPRQLPASPPRLIGTRAATAALQQAVTTGNPVVVTGPAGVGKTVLARSWAADQQVDGTFYLAMHGPASARAAKTLDEAVNELLRPLLGTTRRTVPEDTDGRLQLLADLLHGRQALLLLDDVADPEQVRPLLDLPGMIPVLTSRSSLPALQISHHAHTVRPELDTASATRLLRTIAGDRLEQHQAEQLAHRLDRLPLALLAAGHHLLAHPASLTEQLLDALSGPGQLDELHTAVGGDPRTSLRDALETSCQHASPTVRHLLIHTAPRAQHLTPELVADMLATTTTYATSLLTAASREHLLAPHPDGWTMPQLVHTWATNHHPDLSSGNTETPNVTNIRAA